MYFLNGYRLVQLLSIISTIFIQIAITQCPSKEVSVDEKIKESLANLVNLLVRKSLADLKIPSFSGSGTAIPPMTDNQSQCGRRKVQNPEVTYGLASPGDWPWHVGILRVYKDSDLRFLCGGTLLTKNRILTVAHCVVKKTADKIRALLGTNKLLSTETLKKSSNWHMISEIIINPLFDMESMRFNMATLKLSSPVVYTNYIQPICLWTKSTNIEDVAGRHGYITGWGLDDDNIQTTELTTAPVLIRKSIDCIKENHRFFSKLLTEYSFCAGNRNGTGPCNGDSGGGLYLSEQDVDGQVTWYIRGILSVGPANIDKDGAVSCDPFQDVVFTDVSSILAM